MSEEKQLDKMEALIAKKDKQIKILYAEVEKLEEKYAELACPYKKDTVLRMGRQLFIVDRPGYTLGGWAVQCTNIKSDLTFGQKVTWIRDTNIYQIDNGFSITEYGLVPKHKQRGWEE